jgi:hypothetical protein
MPQPVVARDCGGEHPSLDIYETIPKLRIMQLRDFFTQQEAERL